MLAARDLPGDVLLWDIDTRQEIARWPHGAFKLRALALSQNGQLLAEGSWPPNGRPVVGLWEVTFM